MLIANNISKKIYDRKIVDNFSINLQEGKITGLLGSNGAGKTTIFQIILGLIKPDDGKILLNDTDITKLQMHKRASLGINYLPQETSVFRKLTTEDNIRAVIELANKRGKKILKKAEIEAEIDRIIDEFKLNRVKKTLARSLSGGEQRRLEIARTIALKPQYILFDEPFAGIDPISISDIKNIMLKHIVSRNIAILITDHNVRETLSICDNACIIASGRTICSGSPEHISSNPQVRSEYLGDLF